MEPRRHRPNLEAEKGSKVTSRPGRLDLHRADAYGRSFADVYDRWYHDVTDAAATAAFVARRAGSSPVLELGVGSGRLARPLVDLGVSVIGLDASATMLAQARQPDRRVDSSIEGAGPKNHTGPNDRAHPQAKAATLSLIQADMRAIPLRTRFGAALIAFNTLFNLPSEADQLHLLQQLGRLLADDGALVVEALDVTMLFEGPVNSIGVRSVNDGGLVVSATQLDRQQQTLAGQHLEIDNRGVSVRPWRLRWLTPDQLDTLAQRAGLALAERYSGWDEEPFTAKSDTHVSVYRPG